MASRTFRVPLTPPPSHPTPLLTEVDVTVSYSKRDPRGGSRSSGSQRLFGDHPAGEKADKDQRLLYGEHTTVDRYVHLTFKISGEKV